MSSRDYHIQQLHHQLIFVSHLFSEVRDYREKLAWLQVMDHHRYCIMTGSTRHFLGDTHHFLGDTHHFLGERDWWNPVSSCDQHFSEHPLNMDSSWRQNGPHKILASFSFETVTIKQGFWHKATPCTSLTRFLKKKVTLSLKISDFNILVLHVFLNTASPGLSLIITYTTFFPDFLVTAIWYKSALPPPFALWIFSTPKSLEFLNW